MLHTDEPLLESRMSIAQAVQITLLAVSSALLGVRAEVVNDAAFLRQAVQHGLAEVAASKMALVKSRSLAVKSFADAVLADHARLHEQLQALAGRSRRRASSRLDAAATAATARAARRLG